MKVSEIEYTVDFYRRLNNISGKYSINEDKTLFCIEESFSRDNLSRISLYIDIENNCIINTINSKVFNVSTYPDVSTMMSSLYFSDQSKNIDYDKSRYYNNDNIDENFLSELQNKISTFAQDRFGYINFATESKIYEQSQTIFDYIESNFDNISKELPEGYVIDNVSYNYEEIIANRDVINLPNVISDIYFFSEWDSNSKLRDFSNYLENIDILKNQNEIIGGVDKMQEVSKKYKDERQEKFMQRLYPEERILEIVRDPNTSSDTLSQFSTHESSLVRQDIVYHQNCPNDLLYEMINDDDPMVKRQIEKKLFHELESDINKINEMQKKGNLLKALVLSNSEIPLNVDTLKKLDNLQAKLIDNNSPILNNEVNEMFDEEIKKNELNLVKEVHIDV